MRIFNEGTEIVIYVCDVCKDLTIHRAYSTSTRPGETTEVHRVQCEECGTRTDYDCDWRDWFGGFTDDEKSDDEESLNENESGGMDVSGSQES